MLIGIVTLILISCNNNVEKFENVESKKIEEGIITTIKFTKEQSELASIKTGRITKRSMSNILQLNGKIEVDPSHQAIVSAPMGGYLKSAGMIVGTPIKKGQVLATIENVEFITVQQEYLASYSTLGYLEQEYQRQLELRKQDVNSKKTFQKIESEYKMIQAKVRALEQKIALIGLNKKAIQDGNISRVTNLYAPISGYIKTSNAVIGDYVTSTDVIFEIVNTDKIHLELNAFENNIGKLAIEQEIKFSLAGEIKFDRIARVAQIGKTSGNDNIIIVNGDISKENIQGLLPEMYVKAKIAYGTQTFETVPEDAIVEFNEKDYVVLKEKITQEGTIFKLIAIKKGITQDGYTAIEFSEEVLNNKELVLENAYAIISAIKNSLEEE